MKSFSSNTNYNELFLKIGNNSNSNLLLFLLFLLDNE